MKSDDIAARHVWLENQILYIELSHSMIVSQSLELFPTLINASPSEKENFYLMPGSKSIHWPLLDFDLQIASIIHGKKEIPNLKNKIASFRKENNF